ncbi:hypothetical protein X759_31080 [Mesorhizobium sp. LSHC420B00]|nr:hypothetical protein X759_31080 [Mesorhizobium sp. LSHC420B00]
MREAVAVAHADGSVQVGQAVIVAEFRIALVDHLIRAVPDRIGNAHAVLADEHA